MHGWDVAHWQEKDLWIICPLASLQDHCRSKSVTSKNGNMKEHSQSSEIQGVLSYIHLEDGPVAKPETQK